MFRNKINQSFDSRGVLFRLSADFNFSSQLRRNYRMYHVKFYTGEYSTRQRAANQDKCTAYVEHHFNAATATANYVVVITGANASSTSKTWGRSYAQRISDEFKVPMGGSRGILVGGWNGRGNNNLKYTHMPAILLEPLFVSNPTQAEWVRSEEGQNKLAKVLADSIIEYFPGGGLIGFSVGHKYKTRRPHDRGAAVYGGGTEADYAEIVLEKTKNILETYDPAQQYDHAPDNLDEEIYMPHIMVVKDNQEIWLHTDVDEDDEVMWDEENRILYITTR